MLGVGAGVTFGVVGFAFGFSSGKVEFGNVFELVFGFMVPGVTFGLVVLGVTSGLFEFGKVEFCSVEFGIVVFGVVGAVTLGGCDVLVLLFGVITPGC